jgi:Mn2+/Fe2+ NRAMP family transporter
MAGPGVITGASDDDPSGVGTYAQVGAQFGFGLLWTMILTYPLMASVQLMAARIGRVTGRGIAASVRRRGARGLLYGLVALLLVANTINIGADVGAMGAAIELLVGGPILAYVAGMGILSLVLEVFIPYRRYVSYLKWLTLALLAYPATAMAVHVPWPDVLRATFWPPLSFSHAYLTAVIAVLGTTISPYLFFWQASQEAEDVEIADGAEPLARRPEQAPDELQRISLDTYFGMGVSNVVGFFVIVTTAATLHAHGQLDVQTAADAASALRPLAGPFASAVFALGIVATGLLAVPVLGGSAAYAVGEALRWPVGLERKPLQAKGFYAVLVVATLLGMMMNLFHIDPIRALFWSAVVNGVAAVPILVVLLVLGRNRRIMGRFVLERRHQVRVGITAVLMSGAAVGMVLTAAS